ncbi:HesA/MoeB/ThiF family protein [Candidatus Aerophobetes bacterium]|nr:HesA/MoeB/ThiF family protein [Candidatus Aerophobetes bacterium]
MDLTRYQRQIILPLIGEKGQEKLTKASVLIVGCGGLGCNLATHLVRAGVGKVKIVDKDIVQLPDLQRQILYDEEDARKSLPKAEAAFQKLKKINSDCQIEAFVFEVSSENIETLIGDVELVLDGTDNIQTRLLINEACVKHSLPWIQGAVCESVGMSMNIMPGETACYRCLVDCFPPPEGPIPIINTIPALIASIQATEAFKIITKSPDINKDLIYIDLWRGIFQKIKIKKREDCPVCSKRNFTLLSL